MTGKSGMVSDMLTIRDTDGEEYIYFLTKSNHNTTGERFGVKIVLKSAEGIYESESGPLFCEHARALAFLSFLAKHRATPSNLPYIIEDMLDFE